MKIKKCIPTLLLALVLTLLPLFSVSVSASETETGEIWGKWVFNDRLNGEIFPNPVEVMFTSYLVQDTEPFTEFYRINAFRYSDGSFGLGYAPLGSEYNHLACLGVETWYYEDSKNIDFGTTPQTVPVFFIEWMLENATPPESYVYPPEPPVPPSLDGPGSVLPVFTGVFSWLGSSVLEASTMFWTADGGLSVLGTLAVISLGLALIILILYLISGFLKFR